MTYAPELLSCFIIVDNLSFRTVFIRGGCHGQPERRSDDDCKRSPHLPRSEVRSRFIPPERLDYDSPLATNMASHLYMIRYLSFKPCRSTLACWGMHSALQVETLLPDRSPHLVGTIPEDDLLIAADDNTEACAAARTLDVLRYVS